MRVRDLPGVRVVADPHALDRAVWRDDAGAPGDPTVFRFAPDEAFAAVGMDGRVDVEDEHAIVVAEPGFLALELDATEFATVVLPHVEWPLPTDRPAFVQGAVANVPARIRIGADGGVIVLVARAHAEEFLERIGASR